MVYFFRRFFGLYIDNAIIAVISISIHLILMSTLTRYSFEEEYLLLLQFVIGFLYYLIMEYTFKTTIGKVLLKLKIEGYTNSGLELLKQVLLRYITRFIPFEAFSLLINEKHIMWHDRLSKTYVVDNRKKK